MPDHRLAGQFSVEASAALIRHYRYVEERMMRMMGGWIALTPELPAKLLLGRHVWDCAQHADLWGRRLPELRAAAQQSEPAHPGVAQFMDELEARGRHHETPERLAGMYRVLKPHLLAVYEGHLACANPIYEPPTRRILERCLDEERRHAAAGKTVFDALTREGTRRRRTEAWAEALTAMLRAAGGITGTAPVEPMPRVEHARALDDVVALGNVFGTPDLPDALRHAIDRHRDAVEAGHLEEATDQAAPHVRGRLCAEYAKLGLPLTKSEVVAVARVGAHRMIKLAFGGPGGLVVVQQQWRQGPAGSWDLHGADVVRVEPGS
jgi:hypothetical protein